MCGQLHLRVVACSLAFCPVYLGRVVLSSSLSLVIVMPICSSDGILSLVMNNTTKQAVPLVSPSASSVVYST